MVKISREEMRMGIKVEKEHKRTLNYIKAYYYQHKEFPTLQDVAEHIVIDHESEEGMRNRYYKALNSMEEYLKKTK